MAPDATALHPAGLPFEPVASDFWENQKRSSAKVRRRPAGQSKANPRAIGSQAASRARGCTRAGASPHSRLLEHTLPAGGAARPLRGAARGSSVGGWLAATRARPRRRPRAAAPPLIPLEVPVGRAVRAIGACACACARLVTCPPFNPRWLLPPDSHSRPAEAAAQRRLRLQVRHLQGRPRSVRRQGRVHRRRQRRG